MRIKNLRRKFLVFVIALCALTSSSMGVLAVSQYEIDTLRSRREALAQQAADQAEYMQKLADESALFAVRKLALDQCIATNAEEIRLLNEQIELYNRMLEEKSAELHEAAEAEEEHTRQLRVRMRAMEENGEMSYISVILESASLSEMLGRIADISDITRYDRELEANYRYAKENRAQIAGEYREILAQQEDMQSELAVKRAYLDSQRSAADALVQSLSEDSVNAEAELAAIEEALDTADYEIQQLIIALQREQAAAAAAAAANGQGGGVSASTGTGVLASGSFIWPVPSSGLVTSQYGYRDQPTAGASTNHGGLDINASTGTPIVSAAGGTIISAGYQGGYGNCVIIDHGNGVQTVYAHLDSLNVQAGQSVGQGQQLGGAGSTGVSTGPHLHFEIRNNGQTTDPGAYYDNYSVWNG